MVDEADDDEPLEAYWADVRGPARHEPRPEPRPEPAPDPNPCRRFPSRPVDRPPLGLMLSEEIPGLSPLENLVRQGAALRNRLLDRLFSGAEVRVLDVQVGLFTPDGEVSAEGYARVGSQLRVDGRGVRIDGVAFPVATADWGTVMTAGIFNAEGEALFFLDMSRPADIRASDSLNIPDMNTVISAD